MPCYRLLLELNVGDAQVWGRACDFAGQLRSNGSLLLVVTWGLLHWQQFGVERRPLVEEKYLS